MVTPLCALVLAFCLPQEPSPSVPVESDFYRAVRIELPEGLSLEVGGIALSADGRPLVATRRGEVWLLDGLGDDMGRGVEFTRVAEGLQEPLGLYVEDEWIWFTQRGELTRMRDTDGDDRADEFETVCDAWRVGGNYHEYNFGPRMGADGRFWITTNRAFGDQPFGEVPWRGFAFRIARDGSSEPVACGLRSPAGIEVAPWGTAFYTDNQGEWNGASKLCQIEPGDFFGHPFGLASCNEPEWRFASPGDPPDGVLMPEVPARIPSFRLPAVWFPYDEMGRSPSGLVWDTTEGEFGPFAGQVFVGDQYASSVMRVFLEQVGERWQGACFPFRKGLGCGVTRVAWAADGSLLVGQTNRGWPSIGDETEGLVRVSWTGAVPFEVHEMRARPNGFELTFTAPVDPETAADVGSYTLSSYTYELHAPYGSDEMDTAELEIVSASVAQDGRSVALEVRGLRAGYVHELRLPGLRSTGGTPLLHPRAYYTLVDIPAE